MGYYGGKGLPFFHTTFKGIELTEENKAQSQSIAKNVSDVLNYLKIYKCIFHFLKIYKYLNKKQLEKHPLM